MLLGRSRKGYIACQQAGMTPRPFGRLKKYVTWVIGDGSLGIMSGVATLKHLMGQQTFNLDQENCL